MTVFTATKKPVAIKAIEWDTITPFIMVVWTLNVKHQYSKKEQEVEMIFPLCLS